MLPSSRHLAQLSVAMLLSVFAPNLGQRLETDEIVALKDGETGLLSDAKDGCETRGGSKKRVALAKCVLKKMPRVANPDPISRIEFRHAIGVPEVEEEEETREIDPGEIIDVALVHGIDECEKRCLAKGGPTKNEAAAPVLRLVGIGRLRTVLLCSISARYFSDTSYPKSILTCVGLRGIRFPATRPGLAFLPGPPCTAIRRAGPVSLRLRRKA